MAQCDTWSTRTNSPSVESHRFKTSSKDKGKSTKAHWPDRQTENTPSPQSTEEPDYSSERVAEYVADPINPSAGYEYWSEEESMDVHRADMRMYLESYDATWNHASQ